MFEHLTDPDDINNKQKTEIQNIENNYVSATRFELLKKCKYKQQRRILQRYDKFQFK